MLFNSLDFAVFLPVVFVLYWVILKNSFKSQNILLVIASYIFYGWWDWRFLWLIAFSTLVDFFVAKALGKSVNKESRKVLLWISVGVNLGLLGVFKYYNFFVDNFTSAFSFFGKSISPNTLDIILPVGISFYTFQTLSYTIDVYRKQLEPCQSFIAFSAYVSFFPQLVAGPIERATKLLPQFQKARVFSNERAKDGLRQIIWGLFKKIVIADTCAQYVNEIFEHSSNYSSFTLLLGAVYFAFQIYGDFSGYSDIAIGTAKLFGFQLMQNFATPYFSRDIAEFWRRWHISLSTWFRDYLYIPLGGSRGRKWMQVRNVFIIFIVSGFWHGANWTFIFWGLLNAIYFLPLLLAKRHKIHKEVVASNQNFPTLLEVSQMVITFLLTTLAWVFFRAKNLKEAFNYIEHLFRLEFSLDKLSIERYSFEILPLILILLIFEWSARNYEHPLYFSKFSFVKSVLVMLLIMVLGSFSSIQEFIYFQF